MANQITASLPEHVCIIMDGNGRWAKKRMMPRAVGHRKGVETTRRVVEFFATAGVGHLTLFAFSSENWNRPDDEVNSLMNLFMQSLQKYGSELAAKGIRIRFIGERQGFALELQQQIAATESIPCDNERMVLNIAANYGGRWDIVNASRNLAQQVADKHIKPDEIDETVLGAQLSLGDSPDPDLFIRTGGECRVSNFLLWQMAYSEFYFCDSLWPDFDGKDMQAALDEYSQRQRRYGKTGDQVEVSG